MNSAVELVKAEAERIARAKLLGLVALALVLLAVLNDKR